MNSPPRSNGTEGRGELGAPPDPTASGEWAEVDGYHFDRLVRRTPSTDVYLAYHRAARAYREVVVVQRLAGVDQAALRRSIEAEALRAGTLRHAGIAPVADVGLTRDGRLYFAAARPVGRTLREVLAGQGALTDRRALDLGLAIVDAVAAAHDREMVHGRLDPDSVVLVPEQAGQPERAVVLGFGAAAAQDAIGGPTKEQYPFVSPERIAGERPSLRGDVFSLGSVILGLFTGGPPRVVRAAAGPAGLGEAYPGPREIMDVLRRARAADPRDRYPSARDLGVALRVIRDVPAANARASAVGAPLELPARVPPQDARVSPGPGGLERRGALVAAGVAGVLAAGGVAFAWRVHTGPTFPSPLDTTARVAEQAAPAQAVRSPAVTPVPVQAPAATAISGPQPEPAGPPLATTPAPREVAPGDVPSPAEPVENRTVASAARPAAAPVRDAAPVERRLPAVAAGPVSPGPVTRVTSANAAGDVVAAGPPDTRAAPAGVAGTASTRTEAASTEAARSSSATDVWAAFAEYANAIEARDLARMRRVYPGMPEQQRQAWATFFGSVADLHAPLIADQITVDGATAQVRVRGTYEYQNLRPHRAERSAVRFKVTLARDASGWQIRAVE